MSEADIEATLGGATLDGTYFDGSYFTEAYHDDGTIRYWDAVSADSGEWSVQDGQFCTFYEGQEGACFTVERDGTNCFTFFEKDPDTGAIDEKKWTSRGWIRGHDNTCPDVARGKALVTPRWARCGWAATHRRARAPDRRRRRRDAS